MSRKYITLGDARLQVRIPIVDQRPEQVDVTGSKTIDGDKYEFGNDAAGRQKAWKIEDGK